MTEMDPTEGSLSIFIHEVGMRTIAPDVDMNVEYFSLSLEAPGRDPWIREFSGSSFLSEEVPSGTWTLSLEALNLQGTIIGSNIPQEILIEPGVVTQAQVNVSPLEGQGDLDILVSWPDGLLQNGTLLATLEDSQGQSTMLTTTEIGPGQFQITGTASAGYHSFRIQLMEGNFLVAGAAEALRILAGQTTSGEITLEAINLPLGSVELTIKLSLENPLDIINLYLIGLWIV
jgi:hypothetical protein